MNIVQISMYNILMPNEKSKNHGKNNFKLNLNNNLESFIKLNSNCETAAIWRLNDAHNLASQTKPKLNTGFEELNQLLTLHGWPLNGINELNLEHHGIGELRLLIPALQKFKTQNILLIAPPFLPFAPALAKYGFQTERWLVAQTNSIQDRLWAAEQALLSDSCAAVLCWTNHHKLNHKALRRLQLASKKSKAWFVLLRDQSCLQSPSTASLRLHLKTNVCGKLQIKLIKQNSGLAGQSCTLSLAPHYENWQRLTVTLWPQSSTNKAIELINKQQQFSSKNSKPKKISQTKSIRPTKNAKVVVLTPLSALQSVH